MLVAVSILFPYSTLFRSQAAPVFVDDQIRMRLAITGTAAGLMETRARGLADHPEVHTALQARSEEHTSELQSRGHLVCRLLLEIKVYKHFKHHFDNLKEY